MFGLWLPVGDTLSFLKKIMAGVPSASSRNLALMSGVGRYIERTLRTSSGIGISRFWETSCSSRLFGNSACRASRGTGLPSAGFSIGGIGSGSDGWMFSQNFGISRVGSWKMRSSMVVSFFACPARGFCRVRTGRVAAGVDPRKKRKPGRCPGL